MPVQVDAERILRELNARTNAGLSMTGLAAQGDTGGAIYVRWPSGREGVLTPSTVRLADLRRTADVLELARTHGLPVPRFDLIVPLDDGVAVVQERLPGEVRRLDVPKLDAMVEVNERFAGLLTDRPDVPTVPFRLTEAATHRSLTAYGGRARELLARIRGIEAGHLAGDDLVHTDFNHENVLFDEHGQLTGVIDWAGSVWRGDRRFALVKLRYLLAWEYPHPAVLARLDQLLETMLEPETLRLYWAEWALRMVAWTIRTCRPADVELHLDVAFARLT